MASKKTEKEIKVTLKKSTIACSKKQILTIEALGLSKIGKSKIFKDSDTLRGMINVVAHLVSVEEL